MTSPTPRAAAGGGIDPTLVRFLKMAAKDLAALGLPQQLGLGIGGGEGMTPPQLAELLAKLAEAAGLDARNWRSNWPSSMRPGDRRRERAGAARP